MGDAQRKKTDGQKGEAGRNGAPGLGRFLIRTVSLHRKMLTVFTLVAAVAYYLYAALNAPARASVEISIRNYPETLASQELPLDADTIPESPQAAAARVGVEALVAALLPEADERVRAATRKSLSVEAEGQNVCVSAVAADVDPAQVLAQKAAEVFVQLHDEALKEEQSAALALVEQEIARTRLGQAPSDSGDAQRAAEERLLARKQDIELRIQWEAGVAEILGPPQVASRLPSQVNALIGGLMGLALGLSLALVLEKLDTSIRTVEEAEWATDSTVIGYLGLGKPTPKAATPSRLRIDEDKSPIALDLHHVALSLQYEVLKRRVKSVMVTSAVPGEGKTTLAANLALAIARKGTRVRLIDADLHRPGLHDFFEVERAPGFADALSGSMEAASLPVHSAAPCLGIVSSGAKVKEPSAVMQKETLAPALQAASQGTELVICDAPPVLASMDALNLASVVDAVLLVISANNARRETIRRVVELLEAAEADLLGVVVNGLTKRPSSEHYYYYYYVEDGRKGKRRWNS